MVWDVPDSIVDLGLHPPIVIPRALFMGLLMLGGMLLYAVIAKRQDGEWSPLPDVRKVYMDL